MASNLSTPNIPKLESVKVPARNQPGTNNIGLEHSSNIEIELPTTTTTTTINKPELYSWGCNCFERAFATSSFHFWDNRYKSNYKTTTKQSPNEIEQKHKQTNKSKFRPYQHLEELGLSNHHWLPRQQQH